MARAHLLTIVILLTPTLGCGSRTVANDDSTARLDRSTPQRLDISAADLSADAVLPPPLDSAPDANPACVSTPLALGFVHDRGPTTVDGIAISGTVTYLGKIRQPLASSPAFVSEVELTPPSGPALIVQYFLPSGAKLPVVSGGQYMFIIKRRKLPLTTAEAWIITRPTSGLPPLLMVAEPSAYGEALDFNDPVMSPLTVRRIERSSCSKAVIGCGQRFYDTLSFSSAATPSVVVPHGQVARLTLFGQSYRAYAVDVWHLDMPCPGDRAIKAAFLVLIDQP